jgi:hypothetical protein
VEKKMDSANKSAMNEAVVIKRQWIAFVAAFVLFALASFISVRVFGVAKYSILGLCLPMAYLGISSIKNRVSIARLRGQKGYSRDTRAVIFGVIMLVLATAYVVIVFTPFLSSRFLPF